MTNLTADVAVDLILRALDAGDAMVRATPDPDTYPDEFERVVIRFREDLGWNVTLLDERMGGMLGGRLKIDFRDRRARFFAGPSVDALCARVWPEPRPEPDFAHDLEDYLRRQAG